MSTSLEVVRDNIKRHGYTTDLDVDAIMNSAGITLMKPPSVEDKCRHGDPFDIMVVVAMHQYYAMLGPKCMPTVAKAIINQLGWCEEAWVKIHMWHLVTEWPDKYTEYTGKPIVDITQFWLDAWSADNIEELYEKDY